MDEDETVDLGVVHEKIVGGIAEFFKKDNVHVGAYERFKGTVPSPMIMIELDGAPPSRDASAANGTAHLLTDLEFSAFVIVRAVADDFKAELLVRQLAMRLKGFLHRQSFMTGLRWAVPGEARDAEFEWPKALKNAHEYAIWKVEFVIPEVLLGDNVWGN